MDKTKIRLSPEEEELVATPDWILTKNRVIQKINELLSEVQTSQQPLLNACTTLEHEVLTSSPKISKGENYKGLPWLVLDYPRFFNKDDVFAIRTLFWWGNFFSVTLHLSGKYKEQYEKRIIDSFELLKADGFSFCINEDQWQHHFEAGNYELLSDTGPLQFQERIQNGLFIKLAKKIPLEQWNGVEKKLLEFFSQLINILQNQFPNR